ncbi:unnamed protein product [Choristocarpus tenellus]
MQGVPGGIPGVPPPMPGIPGVPVGVGVGGLPGVGNFPFMGTPMPMHGLGMIGAPMPLYLGGMPLPRPKPMCRHEKCSREATYHFEGDREPAYCHAHRPIEIGDPREKPCHFHGCTRRAVFGFEESNPTVSCPAHKIEGMTNMHAMHCEYPNCKTYPSFAPEGDPKRRFCKKHREPGMVYVNRKNCEIPDCPRMALWMDGASSKKRLCTVHREEGMVCAYRSVICAHEGCFKQPCYGDPAEGKPIVCAEHRVAGMEEVRTRKCMAEGCQKVPSWGINGKRTMCRLHKSEGMTYAILTCEYPQCTKNPSFAPRGETRRRFCKRHSEPEMVNVYYKYCDTEGCLERAVWSNSSSRACEAHRVPGMTGKSSTCQFEGETCSRLASYAFQGQKPRFCALHKTPEMVQTRTRKCKDELCEKIPSFGFDGNSREYCKTHALEGMVYNAGGRCPHPGCRLSGSFNYKGVKGEVFCKNHRAEDMVDVLTKRCEEKGCAYAANFGDPEEKKKRFCSGHKKPGMQNCKQWRKRSNVSAMGTRRAPDQAGRRVQAPSKRQRSAPNPGSSPSPPCPPPALCFSNSMTGTQDTLSRAAASTCPPTSTKLTSDIASPPTFVQAVTHDLVIEQVAAPSSCDLNPPNTAAVIVAVDRDSTVTPFTGGEEMGTNIFASSLLASSQQEQPEEVEQSEEAQQPEQAQEVGQAQLPEQVQHAGQVEHPETAQWAEQAQQPEQAQEPLQVQQSEKVQKAGQVQQSQQAQHLQQVREAEEVQEPEQVKQAEHLQPPSEVVSLNHEVTGPGYAAGAMAGVGTPLRNVAGDEHAFLATLMSSMDEGDPNTAHIRIALSERLRRLGGS